MDTETTNTPRVQREFVQADAQRANTIRTRTNLNPLINVRDRLFHALFFKTALQYAQLIPK